MMACVHCFLFAGVFEGRDDGFPPLEAYYCQRHIKNSV